MGYGVSGVARSRASTFWNPSPRSQTISPFWTIAAEIAGIPACWRSSSRYDSKGDVARGDGAWAATPATRETASNAPPASTEGRIMEIRNAQCNR